MRPTSGPGTSAWFVVGSGRPPDPSPPFGTRPSPIAVVRLPDWKTAAYTVLPSGDTVSARGVSPNNVTMVDGVPPSVAPSDVASNTQTSARPMPAVVSTV